MSSKEWPKEGMSKEVLYDAIKGTFGFHYNLDFVSPEMYQALFDKLAVDGKTIIDLGAGLAPIEYTDARSTYTDILEGRGVRLIPIDSNMPSIQSWRLMQRESEFPEDTHVRPVQADARALPLQPNSVDGAISANLLNHFTEHAREHVRKILEEAFRVIKPGGFFIISTFGYACILDSQGNMRVNNNIPMTEFITRKIIEEEARRIGFMPEEGDLVDRKMIEWAKPRMLESRKIKGEDVTAILMEEPVGLLLRK